VPPPDEFARAWQRWMHTPAPVGNARQRRHEAPTYEAELVMDQLASHVYSLGLSLQAGERMDYETAAADRLRNLHGAEALLDDARLPALRRAPFDQWADATRALLHAVAAAQPPRGH
jgi:hypothetical protein